MLSFVLEDERVSGTEHHGAKSVAKSSVVVAFKAFEKLVRREPGTPALES
jgi:hypothetical protein